MTDSVNNATEKLLASYAATESHIQHLGQQPLPSTTEIVRVVEVLQELIFPGFFGTQGLSGEALKQHVVAQIKWLEKTLTEQIRRACNYGDETGGCAPVANKDSQATANVFLEQLPVIRKMLASDVDAAYKGDPAASCRDEVIASYPSVYAVMVYRLAHALYKLEVPLIPRIMSEHAHQRTGIDLHPATTVGEAFFIDHGTGVVIGGTAVIGNRVKIYQGVTLGAFSFPKDKDGNLVRGTKRHPTIEDDVVIYSGATILGGDTVIGHGSIIGGNVWLTRSVAPGTRVSLDPPKLKIMTADIDQLWIEDYVI